MVNLPQIFAHRSFRATQRSRQFMSPTHGETGEIPEPKGHSTQTGGKFVSHPGFCCPQRKSGGSIPQEGRRINVSEVIYLLNKGIPVLIYAGEYDRIWYPLSLKMVDKVIGSEFKIGLRRNHLRGVGHHISDRWVTDRGLWMRPRRGWRGSMRDWLGLLWSKRGIWGRIIGLSRV